MASSGRGSEHNQADGPPGPGRDEHQSYLLRIWGAGRGPRASLQSIQTGERHMFADLESLFAFLVERARHPGW